MRKIELSHCLEPISFSHASQTQRNKRCYHHHQLFLSFHKDQANIVPARVLEGETCETLGLTNWWLSCVCLRIWITASSLSPLTEITPLNPSFLLATVTGIVDCYLGVVHTASNKLFSSV